MTVLGDDAAEPNETFTVTLSSPTGGLTLGTSSATVTITNDDAAPTPSLTIADATVAEGNNGTKNVTLTVTLSAASATPVTVSYATADGTATAGSDYVAKTGSLTFAPGVLTQTLTIVINGDRVNEANETFLVNLSAPAGATLGDGSATVTITNDDKALTATAAAPPARRPIAS